MKKIIAVAACALMCSAAFAQKWIPLFNETDLTGWKQVTGNATFQVQKKCIVGTGTEGYANSYLATEERYRDFILEFEFKMDDDQFSGVQIRSHVNENGVSCGLQYQLDPSARAWTGGIYDEARRGWIYPLTFNMDARDNYKKNGWNKGRIEAIGNRIRTYLNGNICSDVIDDADHDGFIALQIEAPGSNSKRVGAQVWWRNIRICTESPEKHQKLTLKNINQINAISNTLSEKQQKDGWKLLWDGRSVNGWKNARGGSFPDKGWAIEDNQLKVLPKEGQESEWNDIITEERYKNFWLSVDFRVTPGARSGIKYFVNPDLYKTKGSQIGCEFQIIDDILNPDAQLGVAGNRTCASLFNLIRADKDDAEFRVGEWNTAWIKVKNDHVEHWLNGVKVLEYDRNNQLFNALIQFSEFQKWENFGNQAEGYILLQDQGGEVDYKSIMIKKL